MKSKNANIITFFFKRTFSKRTRNDQKCPNYRVQILYKKQKKRTHIGKGPSTIERERER